MKPAQIAQIVFVLLAAAAVYSFVSTAKDGERRRVCTPYCAMRPAYANANRTAPDFELPGLNGETIRLSDYRGKVVVMNFWTKTCQPCLEEMPSLAELAQILSERNDAVLIAVSTDESVEDARATLKSVLGSVPGFPVAVDADSNIVGDRYGTKLYPETWFIDPNGVIRARFDGARDWSHALSLDLIEAIKSPVPCDIEFSANRASGRAAALCDDLLGS